MNPPGAHALPLPGDGAGGGSGSTLFLGCSHRERNLATAPPTPSKRVTFDEGEMTAGMAVYTAVDLRHLS